MTCGLAIIFACGVLWLAAFARPSGIGLEAALRTGLYPFVPADLIKIAIASAILPTAWRLIGNETERRRQNVEDRT
jgi:biotin transport system substrate-specific component